MFWDRFYNLCILRGTKPNPVAKEIGLSSAIATRWKSTGALPNGETLIKLADYLDCSVDYLLGRTDSPAGDTLSDHEAALLCAYRQQPDMQSAVDKLLGVALEG